MFLTGWGVYALKETPVDAAIVMIENVHKHLERDPVTRASRWEIMRQASTEVGPPLFFSLLIITLSFLPVFSLQAQEGRLFAPLAYTKTFLRHGRGRRLVGHPGAGAHGLFHPRAHRPGVAQPHQPLHDRGLPPALLNLVLHRSGGVLLVSLVLVVTGLWPAARLGTEFMPDLDEGDLLYMPTTFPALSIGKAQQLLQQTDKLIRTVPEVRRVFGKIGRAETATDPAPLTMVETTVLLKPREQWRPGMTLEALKKELNRVVQIPSLANAWVPPIKTASTCWRRGSRPRSA